MFTLNKVYNNPYLFGENLSLQLNGFTSTGNMLGELLLNLQINVTTTAGDAVAMSFEQLPARLQKFVEEHLKQEFAAAMRSDIE